MEVTFTGVLHNLRIEGLGTRYGRDRALQMSPSLCGNKAFSRSLCRNASPKPKVLVGDCRQVIFGSILFRQRTLDLVLLVIILMT